MKKKKKKKKKKKTKKKTKKKKTKKKRKKEEEVVVGGSGKYDITLSPKCCPYLGTLKPKLQSLKGKRGERRRRTRTVRQNARCMTLTCRDSRGLHHNSAMRRSDPIVPEQFNCLCHTRWPTSSLYTHAAVRSVYQYTFTVSFTASDRPIIGHPWDPIERPNRSIGGSIVSVKCCADRKKKM